VEQMEYASLKNCGKIVTIKEALQICEVAKQKHLKIKRLQNRATPYNFKNFCEISQNKN
jgi:hypothetical protein